MAGELQAPRNALVDIADIIAKLSPTFLGSGTVNKTETSTAYSGGLDPNVTAQSDALLNMLMQRGSSTAQADKVVEDILYRAQLAFAPVLGDEKKSGLYNTSVRKQMASETIARATAAASAAVMEDQQRALAAATQLSNQRVAASAQTAPRTQTNTTSQRTAPAIKPKSLLAGVGSGILSSLAVNKGKKALEDIWDKIMAPGQGYDTGPIEDAAGNLYDGGSFSSGAFNAVGGSGISSGGFENSIGSELSFSAPSVFTAEASDMGSVFLDDTKALQQILDSVIVPTATQDMTQVASAGTSDVPQGLAGEVEGTNTLTVASIGAAGAGSTGVIGDVMIGSAAEQSAIDARALTAGGQQADQFAAQVEQAIQQAGLEPGSVEAEELALAMDPDRVDMFGFDEATMLATAGSAVGDVAVGGGIQLAADPLVDALAFDSAALAGADFAATAGADAANFLSGMPIPYFAIANAITDGELGQAVMEIPVVGDVLQSAGEIINDIPIVGDLVGEASGIINDVVGGGVEAVGDIFSGAGDFVGDLAEGVEDVVEDIPIIGSFFGGGDSVICSEAVRQGLLSKELYEAEVARSHELFSQRTFNGYHFWALPIVRRMREDRKYAERMAKWANAYGEFIVHKKVSWRGLVTRYVAVPIAYVTGLFVMPISAPQLFKQEF